MQSLTPEQVEYVRQHAAAFVKAVENKNRQTRTIRSPKGLSGVVISLNDFPSGDMFLVFACLTFARDNQVAVTFVP